MGESPPTKGAALGVGESRSSWEGDWRPIGEFVEGGDTLDPLDSPMGEADADTPLPKASARDDEEEFVVFREEEMKLVSVVEEVVDPAVEGLLEKVPSLLNALDGNVSLGAPLATVPLRLGTIFSSVTPRLASTASS